MYIWYLRGAPTQVEFGPTEAPKKYKDPVTELKAVELGNTQHTQAIQFQLNKSKKSMMLITYQSSILGKSGVALQPL